MTRADYKQQQAPIESEDVLRAMFEHSTAVIIVRDLDKRMIWANRGLLELIGTTADQVVGTPDADYFPPEVVERWHKQWDVLIASSQPIDFEESASFPDGVTRTYKVRSFPIFDANQTMTGFVTIAPDISEEKRREDDTIAKLTTTNLQLHAVLDGSPLAIIHRDSELRWILANRTCLRLIGLTEEQVIGKTDFDLFPEADAERYKTILDQVIETRRATTFDDSVFDTNGIKHTFSVELFPVFDADKNLHSLVSMASDVTDSRRLSESLQREAIRTNRAVEELESFAYSVSHDLRTPLRAIDGFASLLARNHSDELTTEAKRFLNQIAHGVTEMGMLIDDLLSFSRVTKLEIDRAEIDTDQLVGQVVGTLVSAEDEKDVNISIGHLPRCHGDRELMRLVFQNLLSNALKFTSKTPDALIEVGSTAGKGTLGDIFFVRDNGVGFDMKYADKLFGVFQRLHHADEFEGSGVGLATVQRIIQRHGGRVWAEGEVNKGATFYFTLPPDGAKPAVESVGDVAV